MKFCMAAVEYWESLGINTSNWRKSPNGLQALCHLEYAQIFRPDILMDTNVKTCEYNTQELEQALIDGFGNTVLTLEQAQNNALKVMNNEYNLELTQGFVSSASGVELNYAYDEEAQKKFMKLMLMMNSAMLTYPTSVYTKDNIEISLTQAQLGQLFSDIAAWEWQLQHKLYNLIEQIKIATTISEVSVIVW